MCKRSAWELQLVDARQETPSDNSGSPELLQSVELFPGFPVRSTDIVFDMGSGYGDHIYRAAQVAAHVIALDYDQTLLDHVAKRLRDLPAKSFETIISKDSTLPLKSELASVILCTEVLEHFLDPENLMAELVRIGQPGCRYCISVPDATTEKILKYVAPPENFQLPHHVQIFERERLHSLITSAGLMIDEARYGGSYWSFWWILRFASGSGYHPHLSEPPPEVLVLWDRIWKCLEATDQGRVGIKQLELALPKSQIVFAHKP